jgi:hypothetical protein
MFRTVALGGHGKAVRNALAPAYVKLNTSKQSKRNYGGCYSSSRPTRQPQSRTSYRSTDSGPQTLEGNSPGPRPLTRIAWIITSIPPTHHAMIELPTSPGTSYHINHRLNTVSTRSAVPARSSVLAHGSGVGFKLETNSDSSSGLHTDHPRQPTCCVVTAVVL